MEKFIKIKKGCWKVTASSHKALQSGCKHFVKLADAIHFAYHYKAKGFTVKIKFCPLRNIQVL